MRDMRWQPRRNDTRVAATYICSLPDQMTIWHATHVQKYPMCTKLSAHCPLRATVCVGCVCDLRRCGLAWAGVCPESRAVHCTHEHCTWHCTPVSGPSCGPAQYLNADATC